MAVVADFEANEVITPAHPRLSRMENLLMPTNFFDHMYASTKATEVKVDQLVLSREQEALGYHGTLPDDPQYQGVLDFSTDDGYTFSSPAVGVLGNRIVQIRLSLSQYHVNPPILAFRLDWYLPTGWTWTDGLGTSTYEEAVSNPMVVTRVVRSPTNPQPVGFRVLIAERFV